MICEIHKEVNFRDLKMYNFLFSLYDATLVSIVRPGWYFCFIVGWKCEVLKIYLKGVSWFLAVIQFIRIGAYGCCVLCWISKRYFENLLGNSIISSSFFLVVIFQRAARSSRSYSGAFGLERVHCRREEIRSRLSQVVDQNKGLHQGTIKCLLFRSS